MEICGEKFKIEDTYDSIITIPDCFVFNTNQIGTGHGEAKLYLGSKDTMREFFGNEGFSVKCFLLKTDLLLYLNALKTEYFSPSQEYLGRDKFPVLWKERIEKVTALPDVIEFDIADQKQIAGTRGYVNSKSDGYNLIRELSLPLVTYLSVMKLVDGSGSPIFYWKLFVDFQMMAEKKSISLVFYYGQKASQQKNKDVQKDEKKSEETSRARIGQGKYRDQLLAECPFCPITMLNEEPLLIASHIKPWAVCNEKEKTDPKNGFILSPLYDRLFDKGYITFTPQRHMLVTKWISALNKKRLQLKDDTFISHLPMDEKRINYLEFHKANVFKG